MIGVTHTVEQTAFRAATPGAPKASSVLPSAPIDQRRRGSRDVARHGDAGGRRSATLSTAVGEKDADPRQGPEPQPPPKDGAPEADGATKADGDAIAELGDAVGGPA